MSKSNYQGGALPPHSTEAEAALLGCVLLDARAVMPALLRQFGVDNPFYVVAHRTVWETCLELDREMRAIDLITVVQRLRDNARLADAGGDGAVSALQEASPGASSYENYMPLVWEKYLARQVLANQSHIAQTVMADQRVDETTFANLERMHQELANKATRGLVTPQHLKGSRHFATEYEDRWFGKDAQEPGENLPFEFPWKIRLQEMTIFTGDNGSGKSSMLCWMALHLAQAGWKVCIASMEVTPAVTLWMMGSQLLGAKRLEDTPRNRANVAATLEWMAPRIGFYDFLGITHWQHLLDTFRYASTNADYNCFIVDSVMRIGIPDDDWAQQGIAGAQFAQFAQTSNSHVFLVIHENKSDGAFKGRIRGSKQWSDNAHNLVRIERKEEKGAKVDDLKSKLAMGKINREEYEAGMDKLVGDWDARFVLMKQRWPGSRQNGAKQLWFDEKSLQFRGAFADPTRKPAEEWGITTESEVMI